MKNKVMMVGCLLLTGMLFLVQYGIAEEKIRSEKHEKYIGDTWDYIQRNEYQKWPVPKEPIKLNHGPRLTKNAKQFVMNRSSDEVSHAPGTVLVTEHYGKESKKTLAITVHVRQKPEYDQDNGNWYWAHYLADGTPLSCSCDFNPFAKANFVTIMEEGRLWVFPTVCENLNEFIKAGELAKHVIRPVAGPMGVTLKAADAETILNYLADKPGFVTFIEDGRLWVFREGCKELDEFKKQGELAKHVIRPAAGPERATLKAPDAETLDEYLLAKPGFVVKVEDGRLWIFKAGSKELEEFESQGELAKHVIRPAAGPNNMTVKAADADTILEYLHARPGFQVVAEDGRLWVFKANSRELAEMKQQGELAKHVIRPAAGPDGMTLKGPDSESIEAYLNTLNKELGRHPASQDQSAKLEPTTITDGPALTASGPLQKYQKSGFVVKMEDGRLWVFRAGSEEIQEFDKNGELAKHVIRPGAGPDGITLKAPDAEILDDYLKN